MKIVQDILINFQDWKNDGTIWTFLHILFFKFIIKNNKKIVNKKLYISISRVNFINRIQTNSINQMNPMNTINYHTQLSIINKYQK